MYTIDYKRNDYNGFEVTFSKNEEKQGGIYIFHKVSSDKIEKVERIIKTCKKRNKRDFQKIYRKIVKIVVDRT